ncbi:MAG TPA: DUF5694 domain-containing protein [Oligoflexus sp.]|uniref:DUF5694 domain-containing protein n=1 Tax=Oligoflexus sp. TaxID=1971216 RepID=UPI002D3811A8|nr:DUF5694 domain-containing protein [Oligoflexus sp.]HYX36794.1 DUF5694 domain-containing protein [Oligoflexus sp.]
MKKKLACLFLIWAVGNYSAAAESEKAVEVMFLGTYHMGNPGADLSNLKADNIFQQKRQKELDRLVDALAEFRPNRIMVEEMASPPDFASAYFGKFTPEKLKSQNDEIVQVAFRLAQKLKITAVHGIDERPEGGEPDYFPFDKVQSFAEAHKLKARLDGLTQQMQSSLKKLESDQDKSNVAQILIPLNDPNNPLMRNGPFYYELLRFGDGTSQPGADLNAGWYLRNAKIFSKLVQVAKPGDRVFVLFGAGHGYWLRHFASETPGFRLIDPLPYLQRAAK